MGSIELIEFLHPGNIKKLWEEWKAEAVVGFVGQFEFDEENGKITGNEWDPHTKMMEAREYTFDTYLFRELNNRIQSTVKLIHSLKLNPVNIETVASDKVFNKTILRHRASLIERYERLQNGDLPIPGTLKKLDTFIYNHLTRQVIRPNNIRNQKPSNRAASSSAGKSNSDVIIRSLFEWLISTKKVDRSSETAFISFFEGTRNQKHSIKWYGTPEELVGLYYALYNKTDILDYPILTRKPGYHKLFESFIVLINGTKVVYDKKYNSNPKGRAFYIKLIDKINSLT